MTLHPMNLEDVADWLEDPKAIGRPFGQPAGGPVGPEPAMQSQPKALVRRMVRSPKFYAALACIAIWAITFYKIRGLG